MEPGPRGRAALGVHQRGLQAGLVAPPRVLVSHPERGGTELIVEGAG